jgi:hypothetical protein
MSRFPPMNLLRLSFERLNHQIAATADAALSAPLAESRGLPVPKSEHDEYLQGEHMGIAVPLRLRSKAGLALNGVPAFDDHLRNPDNALLLGDRLRRLFARWLADNRCRR